MDEQVFFQNWGIDFRERLMLTPTGSPNRSVERFVALSADGSRYIAEGFELRKKSRQNAQNQLLEFLAARGQPGVFPYLRTLENSSGVVFDGCFWQLRRWQDADMASDLPAQYPEKFAGICAGFLLDLQRSAASPELPPPPNERFYFRNYLPRLTGFAAQKMPHLVPALREIIRHLDKFLTCETALPAMFAHGDFHPGNILTRGGRLAAVIDWEFTGWKHPGYDLALLLGCLGRDDVRWLTAAPAAMLQDRLCRAGYMDDAAWENLTELMAAVRLGWLGEWIDLGETGLAEQEISYIRFLLDI